MRNGRILRTGIGVVLLFLCLGLMVHVGVISRRAQCFAVLDAVGLDTLDLLPESQAHVSKPKVDVYGPLTTAAAAAAAAMRGAWD